jgi:hypothetical protein
MLRTTPANFAVAAACRYGHFNVADALTEELCSVEQKGAKLKEAEWLGKLAVAARAGDAATVKELLQNPRARQLIAKLQFALVSIVTAVKLW